MIQTFANKGTQDVFHGVDSRAARSVCPTTAWRIAARKLDMLNAAVSLSSLRKPPGNMLEVLRGDRRGQHCIRINEKYRICFNWTSEGLYAVEIVDYH